MLWSRPRVAVGPLHADETDLTSGSGCCLRVAEPFVNTDAAEARFTFGISSVDVLYCERDFARAGHAILHQHRRG